MYKALYEYKTDLKNYLSFQTGDQFTILDKSLKDWFLAQNGFGEIGYIPQNYVTKEDVSVFVNYWNTYCIKVNRAFLINRKKLTDSNLEFRLD